MTPPEQKREWAENNREKCREAARAWAKRNLAYQRMQYYKNMRKPSFRIAKNLRARVRDTLKFRPKSGKTLDLIGCNINFLRRYLETFFQPGMAWENYGKIWHIDHKLPCKSFNLADPAQQRLCFHWTNLQPLFAQENISKGAKVLCG